MESDLSLQCEASPASSVGFPACGLVASQRYVILIKPEQRFNTHTKIVTLLFLNIK